MNDDGRKVEEAGRRWAAQLRRDAAERRSLSELILRWWALPFVVFLTLAGVLSSLRAPDAIVGIVGGIAFTPVVAVAVAIGLSIRRRIQQAREDTPSPSLAIGAFALVFIGVFVGLLVASSFVDPPLREILKWFARFWLIGMAIVPVILFARPLLREIANKSLKDGRAVFGLGATIFGLAAQERAEEAGPIGRALPSAPTVEAWQGTVEAARAYRDTIRAHHEVATPSYLTRALAPWGLALIAMLFFIIGAGGIASSATGWASFTSIDALEGAGLILAAAIFAALSIMLVAREGAKLAALRRTAAALNGRIEKGRRAIYRQLDWLDRHNWGPSPMLIMSPGRGDHYTVEGDVRGRPALITMSRRGAPLPRHRYSEWAAIEDGPSRQLTNVFIPIPANQERSISPDVLLIIEHHGFVAHVGRDGVRLSRNDDDVKNLAPERLLPLVEAVLDPTAVIVTKD